MPGHQFKEQLVERLVSSVYQLGHLLGRRHAGHTGHVLGDVGALAAFLKPPLHEPDFEYLRFVDPPGQQGDGLVAAPVSNEMCHVDRLPMVPDHAPHELGIGGDVGCCGCGRGLSRELSGKFGRCVRKGVGWPRSAACGDENDDR